MRVWFSDGGICSNFPVHFFDGVMPTRPTFGVNLKGFHQDFPKDRTYLPEPLENDKGLKTAIPTLSEAPGLGSVAAFVGSIVNTMQNWRDQIQIAMPGYRDRIVHVCHTEQEGGLNLNMPSTRPSTISPTAAPRLRSDCAKHSCPGRSPRTAVLVQPPAHPHAHAARGHRLPTACRPHIAGADRRAHVCCSGR